MIASKERRNFIGKDSSRAGGDGPACACAVRTPYRWGGGGSDHTDQPIRLQITSFFLNDLDNGRFRRAAGLVQR